MPWGRHRCLFGPGVSGRVIHLHPTRDVNSRIICIIYASQDIELAVHHRRSCLTLRENTERPVTVTHGTNRVVGTRTADIVSGFEQALASTYEGKIPELWDGHAADRIAGVIGRFLSR